MRLFEMMKAMGHEQVMLCHDEGAGYRALIAMHSTKLGPAVGGTRLWNDCSEFNTISIRIRPQNVQQTLTFL